MSKKHKASILSLKKQPNLSKNVFKMSNEKILKKNEIRIASFVTEHDIPISVADHLTELIKTICNSEMNPSQISKLSCSRTKCTAIINHVTGRVSFENLVGTLKKEKFSLLVDESTDNSAVKNLAMVVRFNDDQFKIKDEFLSLIPVSDASAEGLYNTIISFFNKHNIPYKKNLVGFAADGANTMMGRKKSLKTLLSKDIPNLFVIKCICHSLALCASYACEKLPNTLEKIIRNIYSYFQHSYKRQSEFKEFQTFLNIKPHKLLHPAQTRWLSLNAAILRVLEQYEALRLYFRSEVFDKSSLGATLIIC